MRRIIRIVLPLIAVIILGVAGTLIAQNIRDQSGVKPSSLPDSGTEQPRAGGLSSASAAVNIASISGSADQGASAASHPYFDRGVTAGGGLRYGVAANDGVFASIDDGATWVERDYGIPRRVVYPFDQKQRIVPITAIGVDPRNTERVAVTSPEGIYLSEDAGVTWKAVPVRAPIKSTAYFTSISLSPYDEDSIVVGTSFSGIYETTDRGRTWIDWSAQLKFLYRGAGFDEEIAGIAYTPEQPGSIYIGVGFGGGLYRSSPDKLKWTEVSYPGTGAGETIRQLQFRAAPVNAAVPSWLLDVATDQKQWSLTTATGAWSALGQATPEKAVSPERAARMETAANRTGIYLSAENASGPALAKMIKFVKDNGMNAVVVDMKDDFGRLTYRSSLPIAVADGAVHPLFNLQELIATAHASGVYVIGRMVVFKDEKLYDYLNHRYAIWDTKRDAPWGNFIKETNADTDAVNYVQKEFWVDPFSLDVWQYNVAIAQELQSLGVDEIQFDYIRFPSDGDLSTAAYRFQKTGMDKIDALESFFALARGALTIPISTDLYGFSCWYRISGWVGQDIEMLANYVDVICPMFYPSHFPRDFMDQYPYLDRARQIYRQGTARAQGIVGNRSIIRPFVQSFLLGGERKMETNEYSSYLKQQLTGAQESHSSGFTLWNYANDYYMVTFPLDPYVAQRGQLIP